MNGSDGLPAEYVSPASVKRVFGISRATLRSWAETGKIQAVRVGDKDGRRLYSRADVEKAFPGYRASAANHDRSDARVQRARICYARVSSAKQRADLDPQIETLRAAYPTHEVVSDIGSGLNWHRKGLLAVLDRAMGGTVEEVVVAHKDRLCRLAYELVEHVLRTPGCRLVVLDRGIDTRAGGPDDADELRDDLLAVVTYFVASNNGKRAAAHRRERSSRQTQEDRASRRTGEEEETAEEGEDDEQCRASTSKSGTADGDGDPASTPGGRNKRSDRNTSYDSEEEDSRPKRRRHKRRRTNSSCVPQGADLSDTCAARDALCVV